MIYENDKFECFLVGNPRSEGHVAISTKKHFKDMMEIDDETCKEIFLISKKLMNIIKKVYNSESVYLCTMCDGPMNHFHVQLIPRYSFEERGSDNFVKKRFSYVEDKEKVEKLRNILK
jgi:histidine triad (HIT) family protein